jgi:hypothetical protein
MKKMKRRVGQNPRWPIYYQHYQLKINSKKRDHDFKSKMKIYKKLIVKLFLTYYQPPMVKRKSFENGGM